MQEGGGQGGGDRVVKIILLHLTYFHGHEVFMQLINWPRGKATLNKW